MPDRPRIIILMHYMELGGAEMALLGLLSALDPRRVNVDLFIYSHQGPLMRFIPDYINLLPEIGAYSVIERPVKEALRRGYHGVATARILAKLHHKFYRLTHPAKGDDGAIMQYVGDYVTPLLPKINPDVEYDLCISFLTPHNIGLTKVRAKKRLAWIHTDYSTVSVNAARELRTWGKYDHIASISEEVGRTFAGIFPSLRNRLVAIENILPWGYMHSRSVAHDASHEMTGAVNLLSIGRFCTAKNYDNIPDIMCRMLKKGVSDVRWYIIGYGGDEALIRQRIAEADMEDYVIILGKKDNPYPYIKACDIYVQPSRYEGKSVTVREAQMLGKPVVVTAYPTAPSQISNGVDGVIVPLDNEGCARGLADFTANISLRQQIANYLADHDYSGVDEVEKIYSLINA